MYFFWVLYYCAVVFFNEDFVYFEVLVAYDFLTLPLALLPRLLICSIHVWSIGVGWVQCQWGEGGPGSVEGRI